MTEMLHETGAPVCDPDGRWRITRHADVVAALTDPRLIVPPPVSATGGPLERLRAQVSRFSNGPAHAQRRSAAVAALAPLDPAALQAAAAQRMDAVLAGGGRIDLTPRLRTIPVSILAEALGVKPELSPLATRSVIAIAAAYQPGAAPEAVAAADQAVIWLSAVLAESRDAAVGSGELSGVAVVWTTLLVQACDATAGLIGNALVRIMEGGWRDVPVAAVLRETLRHDPPVRATVRVAAADAEVGGQPIAAGETLLLDLAAANRDPEVFRDPGRFTPDRPETAALTFGTGLRPCPADRLATALAAGAVEAARYCESAAVEYGPAGNLRIPRRLEVLA